ncbi:MAG TPA: hypothetical protein VI168_09860 [Croceibacterium sp.]
MNLNGPEVLLFLLALAILRATGRPGLFAMWPITFIVFPTARLYYGFPLYLYDIVSVLLLLEYRRDLLALRWGWNCLPWHYVFFALIAVSGVAWPLVVFSPNPQIAWIAFHTSLAMAAFGLSAMMFADPRKVRERAMLGYGLAASIIVMGLIGALQFGSPANAGQIASFFFRDFGDETFVNTDFYAEIAAERAAGPYGSANILGVVAVLGAMAASIVVRNRALLLVTFAAAAIALLSSVSRQAVIGLLLMGPVYFLMTRSRERFWAVLLSLTMLPLLAAAFMASDYVTPLFERFGRWEGGIENDANFVARYVAGPERLAEAISEFPSILLFGTGPDIGKLVAAGVDTHGREFGFASVSYLLFLFQYGILGLVAGVSMHIQAMNQLKLVPDAIRARVAAMIAAVVVFYLTDNMPNISETVTILCLLPIGLCAGCAIQSLRPSAFSAGGAPRRDFKLSGT